MEGSRPRADFYYTQDPCCISKPRRARHATPRGARRAAPVVMRRRARGARGARRAAPVDIRRRARAPRVIECHKSVTTCHKKRHKNVTHECHKNVIKCHKHVTERHKNVRGAARRPPRGAPTAPRASLNFTKAAIHVTEASLSVTKKSLNFTNTPLNVTQMSQNVTASAPLSFPERWDLCCVESAHSTRMIDSLYVYIHPLPRASLAAAYSGSLLYDPRAIGCIFNLYTFLRETTYIDSVGEPHGISYL